MPDMKQSFIKDNKEQKILSGSGFFKRININSGFEQSIVKILCFFVVFHRFPLTFYNKYDTLQQED